MGFVSPGRASDIEAEQARFMTRVYLWMTGGLAATGITAWMTASSPEMLALIFGNRVLMWGLFLVQLGLVFSLSAFIRKISALAAIAIFMGYAVLNGLTFSVIFLVYTQQSIGTAFGITSGMFACLSAYGYLTKRDLSGLGTFFFMALIGLLIAMLVNMFLHNDMFSMMISAAAVLIFSGLTAYDVQKIKAMNVIGNEGTEEDTKEAIYGALALYLDFINLFLHILRLLGGRRR